MQISPKKYAIINKQHQMKPNFLNNFFLRLLSLFIFIFLFRFVFIISSNAPFFFSSSSSNPINFRDSSDYKFYTSIFKDFIFNGFLSKNSSSFTLSNSHISALQDLGINKSFSLSSSNISSSHLPFSDHSFDFMFFHDFNLSSSIPILGFASEIERTLKSSGVLVIHTEIKDTYAFHSLLELFNSCNLIKAHDIPGPNPLIPSIREIILKKSTTPIRDFVQKSDQCSVPEYKIELIKNLEPLIEKEPLKPWITLKRNLKNIKYLTSMVDISFKLRHVYIDVGARSYGSSIGSWFKKKYPKQGRKFEIFAIEADKEFHGEYKSKKGVTLLPYAAWVKNETLFFEINREPTKKNEEYRGKDRGMGRIQHVQSSSNFMVNVDKIKGFDFAMWLKSEFEERDFVVVKMDVEGAEFHLIPRLIESGAICLIDEVFLECHYNRWQRCCPGIRSPKYDKTYEQCIHLFTSLRNRGVFVHQWW